ncbi:MAG: hypothetical protein ACXWA9_06465 [Acidimicrobiia bacterium]
MSRKSRTEVVDDQEPVAETELDETDHHGFWDRATLDADENDDAFASVVDAEGEAADDEAGSGARFGNVTQVDADERIALAEWAESKACRLCKRKIREHHDPELLRHDECRTALRVSRLLRRYN